MSLTTLLAPLMNAENPYRGWLLGFVVCVFLCLFRPTRRFGGIGLFVVAGMMSINVFVHNAYAAFTPTP